jgi:hypothetical protein
VCVAIENAGDVPFSQIGPLTELMQSVAAGVGAGMLLGGFLTGLVGLVRSWSRPRLDRGVLEFSYGGGGAAAILMIVDSTLRHAL